MKKLILIFLCLPMLFSCGKDSGSKRGGKDSKHEKNYSKRSKKEKDIQSYLQITLEVMVVDLVKALSNQNKDERFKAAIANTLRAQEDSQDDFLTMFGREYEKLAPAANTGLSALFSTPDLRGKVDFTKNNQEVLEVLKIEVERAITTSVEILRTRIDRFGVTQPNIRKSNDVVGRIFVELPGIKDPERARKLLQSTGQLEFWETYENNNEFFQKLQSANAYLRKTVEALTIEEDSTFEAFAAENPLYALLYPNIDQQTDQLNSGPVVGYCLSKDTIALNVYLKNDKILDFFPRDVKFAYRVKPSQNFNEIIFFELFALKSGRNGKSSMEGDVIADASAQINIQNAWEVSMSMNKEGAKDWKRLTADNIGKSVAIVLDGYVYSAPTVQAEISAGRSQITGNFTVNEANDLVNILKSGKLPAPVRIIEEAIIQY